MGSQGATIAGTSSSGRQGIPSTDFQRNLRPGLPQAPAGARLARRKPGRSPAPLATFLLQSCSAGSAPAISLFGAYFPSWLIFGIVAVLFASLSRLLFGVAGRAEFVPYPLFTHLAIGILVAGLLQILWFGR